MVLSIPKSQIITERDKFLASCHRYQKWTIPDSVIYYITKNPLYPEMYQKLIQNCKYFFVKNPIIIADNLFCELNNEWTAFLKSRVKSTHITKNYGKFWIVDGIFISDYATDSNAVSSIIPKIYRSDVTKLWLKKQIISFNDFVLISSNVESINFFQTMIKNDNGSIVPLEILVKTLSKIKFIEFTDILTSSSITSNTVKELLKLPHFSKIKKFTLCNISDLFDINKFFKYIKENTCTTFRLQFSREISQAYKNSKKFLMKLFQQKI